MRALAQRPDLPLPAVLRAQARALTYDDADPPKSVGLAAEFRERAMVIVDLAKRAGVDEVEYALVAREAERALGRVLLAGREAGKIARESQGRNGARRASIPNLRDLGIEPHLANDAKLFAEQSASAWDEVVNEALLDDAVSRAALVKRVRSRLKQEATDGLFGLREGTEEQPNEGEEKERGQVAAEELAHLVHAVRDVERGLRDLDELYADVRHLLRDYPWICDA